MASSTFRPLILSGALNNHCQIPNLMPTITHTGVTANQTQLLVLTSEKHEADYTQ